MKNAILRWLGINPWMLNIKDVEDCMLRVLIQRYDIEGMSSKLDDYIGTVDDLEYKAYRWSDMADKIEDLEINDIVADIEAKLDLDKIQQLDDRLTELLAGYKLDVQLMKEDF